MSSEWNFGYWADRYYQGWMLKQLGRTAEAVTYFDGIRAEAAHKFNGQLPASSRRDLLEMAYNGLNEDDIRTHGPGLGYQAKD